MLNLDLDSQILEEVLVRHTSGVWLLSPPRPEQAEHIKAEQLGEILDYLRNVYAYIIVDTASEINNIALAAFERSDLAALRTEFARTRTSMAQQRGEKLKCRGWVKSDITKSSRRARVTPDNGH